MKLRHLPLNLMLPLTITLLLLVMVAGGIATSARQLTEALQHATEAHVRTVAYSLALEAVDHLSEGEGDPHTLWPHVAHLSTDRRISAIAVLGPDGQILTAHRLDWLGQPASQVLPELTRPVTDLSTKPGSPVVHWSDGGRRAAILVGYVVPQPSDTVRSLVRGSIYVEADLHDELADILRQAILGRLPELFTTALLLLLLGLWLRWQVTQPLAALERASGRLASADLAARAPETGPDEVVRLARSFNQMATTLQAADAELRASEDRLSTILYSTGDAMMVTDTEQRITLLNRMAERLTGWTEAEALGRPVAQVFRIEHASTGAPAEIPVARVLAERHVVGLANHTVLISRDGVRCHIADSAAPVYLGDGTLTGVVLVFRDVSAAYRLEQALADSEWHYRTLANSGRLLIWTSNRDGDNTWCNELWEQYTGQSTAAAAGAGWLDPIHPDDRAEVLSTAQSARLRLQAWSMEIRLRRADGNYRWMLNDASPRYDSSGRYLGYIGHCLDITLQHEAQQQLQRQLAELRRLQTAMLGREDRISELKQEVNALLQQHNASPRYNSPSSLK
jgi:PAS domain S-box-containing protein